MPVYEIKKCCMCGKVSGCTLEAWYSEELGYVADYVCVSCNLALKKLREERKNGEHNAKMEKS